MMKWILPAAATMAIFASSSGFAQTTPPSDSAPPAVTAPSVQPAPAEKAPAMTEDQAKALIDATVVSSDNKNVGDVAAIQRDSEGKITELHADVGGFLGIGKTRVKLMPSQFTVTADNKVQLSLTADQVKSLPALEK
jgi:hypothetical protein